MVVVERRGVKQLGEDICGGRERSDEKGRGEERRVWLKERGKVLIVEESEGY